MQIHEMKLTPAPFEAIKNGSKRFELRLNDEKRQKIKIGDQIVFNKLPELEDTMTVKVISLTPYVNFAEMFDGLQKEYPSWNKEDWVNGMYEYYSKEDEEKYGALAIGIKLIDSGSAQ